MLCSLLPASDLSPKRGCSPYPLQSPKNPPYTNSKLVVLTQNGFPIVTALAVKHTIGVNKNGICSCGKTRCSPLKGNKNILSGSGQVSYFCIRRHPEHCWRLFRQRPFDMHAVHVVVHALWLGRKKPGCQRLPRKKAFVKYLLPATCSDVITACVNNLLMQGASCTRGDVRHRFCQVFSAFAQLQ